MRFLILVLLSGCHFTSGQPVGEEKTSLHQPIPQSLRTPDTKYSSFQLFLKNLPEKQGKVTDFRGNPISNQSKHYALLNFDVGNRDLQQCADALIRLRAEFLYAANRRNEISFRFNSGEWFYYKDYLQGKRPAAGSRNNKAYFVAAVEDNHASLRKYLDIIFNYTNTLALERDLKPAQQFEVGTIVVKGGSPGHCFIIIDERIGENGEKLFKLAESYMPAQTIYILKNPEDGSPWHRLSKERITTASYDFKTFRLRRFE